MLVVNRVELVLLYKLQQMRKLESSHTCRLEQKRKTGDKVIDIGHMREDIVSRRQVGALACRNEAGCQFNAKKRFDNFNSLVTCCLGSTGSRLNPQARDAPRLGVLQKIAVVGSNFNHVRLFPQAETLRHCFYIVFGMLQPGCRERAKVGVVRGEEFRAVSVILGLHQPAFGAG